MAVTDLTTTTSTSPAKAVEVDPTTLEFDANVRTDMCLDRGFLSSLRERGVLEPIVCYHRDHDHTLVVLHGHRRTLAVVQAARSVVPVHVVARPQEVHRVIDQMSEHRHRAGLTAAEDAAWIAQLEAFGLSAGRPVTQLWSDQRPRSSHTCRTRWPP